MKAVAMCAKCDILQGNIEISRSLEQGLTDLGTIALIKADIVILETLLLRAQTAHPLPVTK